MQPEDSKTVRLGWIAIDVVVDAKDDPISAHVTLHGEKGSTLRAAMVFAKVAELAQLELRRLVLQQEAVEEATSDTPQHAATCAEDGPADACGCRGATSVSAPEVPGLDPLTIMAMVRERVLAHGGSFLETVRDLVEAHKELRIALSPSGSGRPQK